jgi:hypothetical protein
VPREEERREDEQMRQAGRRGREAAEWQNGTNQGIMGSGRGGWKMGKWKRKKRRSKGRKRTMENCQT